MYSIVQIVTALQFKIHFDNYIRFAKAREALSPESRYYHHYHHCHYLNAYRYQCYQHRHPHRLSFLNMILRIKP